MEPCAAAPFVYGVFLSQPLFWLVGLPSQSKPVGFANFPKGDGKPSQSAPAGAGAPERVQPAEGWQKLSPQRRAFAESGAANVVSLYDPSHENGISERPQAFRYPEI